VAIWCVTEQGDSVALTYSTSALPGRLVWQPCGEAPAALAHDLEGWVGQQAAPWDVIRSPRGVFVKQLDPTAGETE